jgi:hypothetical protein
MIDLNKGIIDWLKMAKVLKRIEMNMKQKIYSGFLKRQDGSV